MSRDLLAHVLALVGDPAPGRVVVVAGGVGCGKTTAVIGLAAALGDHGVRVGGIAAPRVVRDAVTIGYDAADLATGRAVRLAALTPPGEAAGRFYLKRDGLRFAHDAIARAVVACDVVCVDEVGPAELAGAGHAAAVALLLASTTPAVLVVRDRLVDRAIGAFAIERSRVFVV